MRIGIIGAGIAGLACATLLASKRHEVQLFDKGRGPGGRMAARRVPTAAGEAAFDHGAQYFTARNDGFRNQVEAWAAAGLAARWPAAGPEAWVGTPAMNAPLKALAQPLDVRWGARVDALLREGSQWRLRGEGVGAGPFDAVVVAVPAEQAAPLLAPWSASFARRAEAARSAPCWTLMAAFANRVDAPDVLRDPGPIDGPIGWAARNSAKPGRSGPEAWVVQAGAGWSAAHLEQTPEAVVPALLQGFAERTGAALPAVLSATAHRWRYARSGAEGSGTLWDAGLSLGVCGDWLLGPRVESAWISGTGLAAGMLAAL